MADPAAAPMPADDPAAAPMDDAGAAPAADPKVLCTVLMNADGTYVLQAGDEPESGAPPDGGDLGAAPAPGGDMGAEPAAPQGQTFDSPGALLKAILGILDDAAAGPGGSPQDNFSAGFEGGSSASPPKPAGIGSKY